MYNVYPDVSGEPAGSGMKLFLIYAMDESRDLKEKAPSDCIPFYRINVNGCAKEKEMDNERNH